MYVFINVLRNYISPRMWLLFSILLSSTGMQIFVVNERNCTNFVSYWSLIVVVLSRVGIFSIFYSVWELPNYPKLAENAPDEALSIHRRSVIVDTPSGTEHCVNIGFVRFCSHEIGLCHFCLFIIVWYRTQCSLWRTLSDKVRINVLGLGSTCIINRWRILRIRSLNDLCYLYSLRARYKLHSTLRTYQVQISEYFFPEVLKIQQVFEHVNFIMKFPKIISSWFLAKSIFSQNGWICWKILNKNYGMQIWYAVLPSKPSEIKF
jgi:hypothetical protein